MSSCSTKWIVKALVGVFLVVSLAEAGTDWTRIAKRQTDYTRIAKRLAHPHSGSVQLIVEDQERRSNLKPMIIQSIFNDIELLREELARESQFGLITAEERRFMKNPGPFAAAAVLTKAMSGGYFDEEE